MKFLALLLIGFALASVLLWQDTAPTQHLVTLTPAADIAGYSYVGGDEFDVVGLDTEKWNYRFLDKIYQAGLVSETAVSQPGDGFLHLSTSYVNGNFLVGMIQSTAEYEQGYFEASIRFQSLQGHHGSFWLQSPLYGKQIGDPGRSGAEIDIVEFFGNGRTQVEAQQNVYWNPYNSEEFQQRTHNIYFRQEHGEELSQKFHVFSLLWTPDQYTFYIDGVETWSINEGISQTKQYIVLSLTTSDWENARLNISQLPDEMLVDYVRVYAPNTPVAND